VSELAEGGWAMEMEFTCTGGLFQWGNHWFGSFGVILETLWRSRQSINAGFSIASFEYRTGGSLDVSCLMPPELKPPPAPGDTAPGAEPEGGNGWEWMEMDPLLGRFHIYLFDHWQDVTITNH
jgi:hypothetical protein